MHLQQKREIVKAISLALLTLVIPFILWILDGYIAFAQIYDFYQQGSCGACTAESVSSQLLRINYGIWILVIGSVLGYAGAYFKKRFFVNNH